ncbi:ectoine/hydroxyectoine ABC transporter substrate-binding protein EhuB [Aureimonas fodinaquatilis]|uniref:Ectoine/hydroxyectoine ABC transporter substrate-binding protein EhuB n=1 Tax=Aureimonas fodinaquatilis TaxID=2565783 RepID=A0A5B0DQ66_9HYPH|nr:ectoine/hydroxyectoine ABC transporter substrate-binding protein EhuB [Aureimonas fodinaquatilis]KAA0968105.1 ectoine/hydroxyectoine ABC transporter substrate-binding protein EhuB [Aureimonas fodinaquatilis]
MKPSLIRSALLGASVVVLALGAQTASAQEALDTLKQQGFARIAIANEPPFTAVNPDGSVSGAGPDVARAVFKRLGVDDVVASISEYGAMIPGLQARRFDAVTAGLFMKPERCAAVAYSEPILCDAEAFLLKAGNPLNLRTYKDIADNDQVRIGAPGGGTEERLALEAGVPRDRVIVVPDAQSGITMLQQGRIEVYSLPVLSINALFTQANDSSLEVVAPVEGAPVYCDGAAFRKDQTDLRDAFDRELAALKESGEFASIIEPYGFSAAAAIGTNREALCAQQ